MENTTALEEKIRKAKKELMLKALHSTNDVIRPCSGYTDWDDCFVYIPEIGKLIFNFNYSNDDTGIQTTTIK